MINDYESAFADLDEVKDDRQKLETLSNMLFREIAHLRQTPYSTTSGEGPEVQCSIIGQIKRIIVTYNYGTLSHVSKISFNSGTIGGVLHWQSSMIDTIKHAIEGLVSIALVGSLLVASESVQSLTECIKHMCQLQQKFELHDATSVNYNEGSGNMEDSDVSDDEENSRSKEHLENFGFLMPLPHQLLLSIFRLILPILSPPLHITSSNTIPTTFYKVREKLLQQIIGILQEFPESGHWTLCEKEKAKIEEVRVTSKKQLMRLVAKANRQERKKERERERDEDKENDKLSYKELIAQNEKEKGESEEGSPLDDLPRIYSTSECEKEYYQLSNAWLSLLHCIVVNSPDRNEWRTISATSAVSLLPFLSLEKSANDFFRFVSLLLSSAKATRRLQGVEVMLQILLNKKILQSHNHSFINLYDVIELSNMQYLYAREQDKLHQGNKRRCEDEENQGENDSTEIREEDNILTEKIEKLKEGIEKYISRSKTIVDPEIFSHCLSVLCERVYDSNANVRSRSVQGLSALYSVTGDLAPTLLESMLGLKCAEWGEFSSPLFLSCAPCIGINVRELFAQLVTDERASNRKAALVLFDDITKVIRKHLSIPLETCFKELFPLEYIKALIDDKALVVRKQSVASLSELVHISNNNALINKLWLSLVLPCYLDPETSVSVATLEAAKSLLLSPLSAYAVDNVSYLSKLATTILQHVDQESGEILQRMVKKCHTDEALVLEELLQGTVALVIGDITSSMEKKSISLPFFASLSSLTLPSALKKKKTQDQFALPSFDEISSALIPFINALPEVISQWSYGSWVLLEELSLLLSFKGKGFAQCGTVVFLSWIILEVYIQNSTFNCYQQEFENSSLLSNNCTPPSSKCSFPSPAPNSAEAMSLISRLKTKLEIEQKIFSLGGKILMTLRNLAEGDKIPLEIHSLLKTSLWILLESNKMPLPLINPALCLYSVLNGGIVSTRASLVKNKGGAANMAETVAKMQKFANEKSGEIFFFDVEEGAITNIERHVKQCESQLVEYVKKSVTKHTKLNSASKMEHIALQNTVAAVRKASRRRHDKNEEAMDDEMKENNRDVKIEEGDVSHDELEVLLRQIEFCGVAALFLRTTITPSDRLAITIKTIIADPLQKSRTRSHAIACYGRFLLRGDKSKEINVSVNSKFISELCRGYEDSIVRNTSLIVLCDLCRLSSGSGVEQYAENLSLALSDPSPLLRKQALRLLCQLISEDYLKVRSGGMLVFRLLFCLADTNDSIRYFCELFFQRILFPRSDKFVLHILLETVLFFNNCGGDKSLILSTNSRDSLVSSVPYAGQFSLLHAPQERRKIFFFLMQCLKEIDKKDFTCRAVSHFLGLFVEDGEDGRVEAAVAVPTTRGSAVESALRDVLRIISAKMMRIGARVNAGVGKKKEKEEEGNEGEDGNSGTSELLFNASKNNLSQEILPVLLALKKMFEKKLSPLIEEVHLCLCELLSDFKAHIHELLPNDRALAKEIENRIAKSAKDSNVAEASFSLV